MAKTSRRWTKEEEDILVKTVQENPHNLTQCFKEVSAKIERSESGVLHHWYAVLSNPKSKKYVGTTFLMLSRKEMLKDRKIFKVSATGYCPNIEPIKQKKLTLWEKIKNLLNIK